MTKHNLKRIIKECIIETRLNEDDYGPGHKAIARKEFGRKSNVGDFKTYEMGFQDGYKYGEEKYSPGSTSKIKLEESGNTLFQRRHYEKFADFIKQLDGDVKQKMCDDLIKLFKQDSTSFNPARFRKASGC